MSGSAGGRRKRGGLCGGHTKLSDRQGEGQHEETKPEQSPAMAIRRPCTCRSSHMRLSPWVGRSGGQQSWARRTDRTARPACALRASARPFIWDEPRRSCGEVGRSVPTIRLMRETHWMEPRRPRRGVACEPRRASFAGPTELWGRRGPRKHPGQPMKSGKLHAPTLKNRCERATHLSICPGRSPSNDGPRVWPRILKPRGADVSRRNPPR